MVIINKGFQQKHKSNLERLPPGQYETMDFPVLSIRPTPHIDKEEWKLTVFGTKKILEWNWTEFNELPMVAWDKDIHCVTKWSKFNTKWKGVLIDEIMKLAGVGPNVAYLLAYTADGYSTNLPLEDVTSGKAMIAVQYEGMDIPAEHGGPARLLVPHLYFWKSAKWLIRIEFVEKDVPGFWETRGYNNHGDPWKEERYSEF